MMVKQRFPALIILILLVGLTWLLTQTQTLNLDQHYQLLNQLRSLKTLDAVVNTDLLKTRFGLVGSYDPLVLHWRQFQDQFHTINGQVSALKLTNQSALSNQFQVLQNAVNDKDTTIEQFKSQNSVLYNSLRYFPIVSRDLMATEPLLEPIVNRLLQDILMYNLDATTDLRPHIATTLSQLETQPRSPATKNKLVTVIVHGRAIVRLQSDVETLVTTLLSLPTDKALNDFATIYEHYYKQRLKAKNGYQILLYLIAIFLLLCGAVRFWRDAERIKAANQWLEQKVNEQTQELRQALQTLQRSQAQLIHAEKMTGLGQLVAGIAHEVNNPINFIYGNLTHVQEYMGNLLHLVDLYQQHYGDPVPEIDHTLESIDINFLRLDLPKLLQSMEMGAERISDIVTSLRTFSRKDEVDYKATNLHDGIDSSLLILDHRLKSTAARPAIAVQKHYGDLPLVECHPGQLNQVFMNLIANAIDALETATAPQPMITIQTELIQSHASASSVYIRITDNGSGIPKEIQTRLFEPFFTTKPVGKGTGLGLSISYQIVTQQHRGLLECVSQVGQGAEFVVKIPIQQSYPLTA
jgi:signal transduction histidine kinase